MTVRFGSEVRRVGERWGGGEEGEWGLEGRLEGRLERDGMYAGRVNVEVCLAYLVE